MNQELLQEVGKVVPEKILQGLLNEWNPILTVDRTVRPMYPDFVKEIKYPEFELAGPNEFDVEKLEHWLDPKQKDSTTIDGREIHEKLIVEKLLESCLGLVDLLAIQARGIGFFRKHFLGKAVFGWKSVVMDNSERLCVPCLFENGGEVRLYWGYLSDGWLFNNPALRFAS